MKKLEDDLTVDTEYYLDNSDSKEDRGIFLRADDVNVYFKKTSGNGYTERDGVIPFEKEDFNYKEV